MPSPCVVPLCNTNYRNGPKLKVYSFPKDPELSKRWIVAIKRENFTPSKYSRVSEFYYYYFTSKLCPFTDENFIHIFIIVYLQLP